MRIEPRTITESNVNPKGYRNVVVEGYTPEQVVPFLPNCFIVFQNTEEDYENAFCCTEGVLNALKPNLFVCSEPSEGDIKLCKSFGCEVITLEELVYSSMEVEDLNNGKLEEKLVILEELNNQSNVFLGMEDEEISEVLSNSFKKTLEATTLDESISNQYFDIPNEQR